MKEKMFEDVKNYILNELHKNRYLGVSYCDLLNHSKYPCKVIMPVIKELEVNHIIKVKKEIIDWRIYLLKDIKEENSIMQFIKIKLNNVEKTGIMISGDASNLTFIDNKGNLFQIPTYMIKRITKIRDLSKEEETNVRNIIKDNSIITEMITNAVNKRDDAIKFLTYTDIEPNITGIGYKNLFALSRMKFISIDNKDVIYMKNNTAQNSVVIEKKYLKAFTDALNYPYRNLTADTFYKRFSEISIAKPVYPGANTKNTDKTNSKTQNTEQNFGFDSKEINTEVIDDIVDKVLSFITNVDFS